MTAIWFCCACVGGGVAQLDVSGCMRGRISEVWPPTMVLLASDYSPEFFFYDYEAGPIDLLRCVGPCKRGPHNSRVSVALAHTPA